MAGHALLFLAGPLLQDGLCFQHKPLGNEQQREAGSN